MKQCGKKGNTVICEVGSYLEVGRKNEIRGIVRCKI